MQHVTARTRQREVLKGKSAFHKAQKQLYDYIYDPVS